MIVGLTFAALALPAPTAAIVTPPKAAVATAPAPAAGRRSIKLSPQGTGVVKQWAAQKDPGLQMLVQQQRDIRSQMETLVNAPKIDVARLEDLMKKQESLQSDIRQRTDARMLALVKALPEADRSIFLKGILPQRAAAAAIAPTAPPPAAAPAK
jgi:uncharacterized membrane protein